LARCSVPKDGHRPAATILRANRVKLIVEKGPLGEYFKLTGADLKARLSMVIDAWGRSR